MFRPAVNLSELHIVQQLAVLGVFGEPRRCTSTDMSEREEGCKSQPAHSLMPQPTMTFPFSSSCMLPSLEQT